MFKRFSKILLLGTLVLLVAGCTTVTAVPTAVPTAIVVTSAPIVVTATSAPTVVKATQVATTAVVATQMVVTATPLPATKVPTPKNTAVPTASGAFNADGTPVSSESSIIITSIKASDVKAQISWTAKGTFDKGFWIYYSTSYKMPFYGGYPLFQISDGTSRTAYVDGNSGTTYYYRICAYNGSGCDFYSNAFSFTFPGATPTP